MRKIILVVIVLYGVALSARAQLTPEITSWILNITGATGYAGIPSNVQQVQYSADNVYVSATCIPGYDIGPWQGNPNIPANQNFVFKITRNPVENTGVAIVTGLGHIGVWSNGVSIYNPKDGMSYNNAGVWNRNALYYEGASFDSCLGHPAPNGEYHHHVNPRCLYDDTDSTHHSPIIGYAFDGFPIYGAYAYAATNGTGPIKRMRSSYILSANTTRSNGPDVNGTYPAGCFVEDYIFNSGSGDLDIHNGRFCITPEYPNGIYAYFVTIDETLYPAYPYVIGPAYYGTVQSGNTGPGSGHNII
ncbi:MAG TPA: YHYH protein, partial [Puia sp.]|nr:YHYH protein [Puia sp.]